MTPCLASSSQLFQRIVAPLSSGFSIYSHEAVQEDFDCLSRKMKAQCSLKHGELHAQEHSDTSQKT